MLSFNEKDLRYYYFLKIIIYEKDTLTYFFINNYDIMAVFSC